MIAVIVTIPPGGETGWHEHAVPLFGYMLDGVLTVDYGDKGTRVYRAGDSLMEAMNWPHDGINKGDVPVRILAVYLGAEGVPNATPVAKVTRDVGRLVPAGAILTFAANSKR